MTHVYQLINVRSSLGIDECTITMIKIAFVKMMITLLLMIGKSITVAITAALTKINIVNNTSH